MYNEYNKTIIMNIIYSNIIGDTFQWKNLDIDHPYFEKINITFCHTGLMFDIEELKAFSKEIEVAIKTPIVCDGEHPKDCKSILLRTPVQQVSFAMSYNELILMLDLIKGTLFKLKLSKRFYWKFFKN